MERRSSHDPCTLGRTEGAPISVGGQITQVNHITHNSAQDALLDGISLRRLSRVVHGAGRAGDHPGGRGAFEAFFWRHERDILGYLWRLTGDEQAAHDLSQETFVRAWQHFDKLQHYDQPRAWLFRVASNLGINHLRGRARRPVASASAALELVESASGDPAHRLAEHDAIRQTVLELPPRQRAAVVLCDVYGLSSAEAAAALGLSHGSLKMALWRGRERFRQDYQRKGGAE